MGINFCDNGVDLDKPRLQDPSSMRKHIYRKPTASTSAKKTVFKVTLFWFYLKLYKTAKKS
ncbi:MAG: hypothetical protein NVS3B3_15650 [Aquirhabdus sp.]